MKYIGLCKRVDYPELRQRFQARGISLVILLAPMALALWKMLLGYAMITCRQGYVYAEQLRSNNNY